MLTLSIKNIIPISKARANINEMVSQVFGKQDIFLVTKGGTPKAAVVDPDYLDRLVRYYEVGSLLEKTRASFEDYLMKDKKMTQAQIEKLTDDEVQKILGLTD